MMDTIHLASEITESQKVRSDLLKWKVIAVALIASVGLGISSKYLQFELALCVIPFVMSYIDALCIHINLRIFSIAKWHRTDKAEELEDNSEFIYMQEYEKFTVEAFNAGAFNLEKWTIFYSSLVVNLVVVLTPLFGLKSEAENINYWLVASGLAGLFFTIVLNEYMLITKKKIESIQYPNN